MILKEKPLYDCKEGRHCWQYVEHVVCRIRLFWFWSYDAERLKHKCAFCEAVSYRPPLDRD
jgi:hypothetical protein